MMKKILAFTLAILLVLPVNLAWGQSDEGYGETEIALGQFVDSFETSGNISVAVDVIRNSTLEVMELNYSGAIIDYENFTTFTEVDAPGDLTITSDLIIDWTTMRRDSTSHAWKDYGVDYFGDFEIMLTVELTDVEAGDSSNVAICWPFAFSNSNGGRAGVHGGDGIGIELSQSAAVDDRFRYRLFQQDGGAGTFATFGAGVWVIDTHYLTLNRTGTTVSLWIYDDAGRTNLIETISNGVADITEYRYIEVAVGYDVAGDPADHSTGSIEDLALGNSTGGYELEGYFSTVDYLADPLANGSALVSMVNTSIPANTQILLQFSDDNATWGDAEGVPLDSIVLGGGFESFDLRDLNYSTGYWTRFNLSTSDYSVTPRVYQNRLITTIGQDARNILNGSWVYYNLTAILNITGVHDAGFLNSTYFIDGNTWNCSEVVGAPGYIVNFNVTGIDTEAISLWLVNYVYYDGISAHHIHVEAWNFTAPGWVEIGIIDDDVGFEWHNYTVYEMRIPNDFVNSTGAFVGRFNHVDAGNINDDIMFERINLLAFVPTVSAVAGVGVNWGLLWFFLILICVPILLVLWKGSKR